MRILLEGLELSPLSQHPRAGEDLRRRESATHRVTESTEIVSRQREWSSRTGFSRHHRPGTANVGDFRRERGTGQGRGPTIGPSTVDDLVEASVGPRPMLSAPPGVCGVGYGSSCTWPRGCPCRGPNSGYSSRSRLWWTVSAATSNPRPSQSTHSGWDMRNTARSRRQAAEE